MPSFLSFLILISALLLFMNDGFPAVYEVGPSKQFSAISQVPLDSLEPGDVVKIYYRPEPYREKFILRTSGAAGNPIVITGVPEGNALPVIDGSHAIQSQKENSKEIGRGLIKIGDNTPGDYIQIRNLELRNANNSLSFVIDGQVQPYEDNAAGVFVRFGRNILIAGCVIHSCGNGVQTTYGPAVAHVTLHGCRIYDNGNHLDLKSDQEHNVYLCGTDTLIQGCRFGDTHADGNNIKDRGRNTIIRYSWIEGGKNHQIDLVDYKEYGRADAYVYGNVIIQAPHFGNNNMINWGGESASRSGTLYLFNNTFRAEARDTRFLMTRYPDCSVSMKNNVFVGSGSLWNGIGFLYGSNNWFSSGITIPSHLFLGVQGQDPGFSMSRSLPYLPRPGSPLINNGTNQTPMTVHYMPTPYGDPIKRQNDGRMDIGAFEYSTRGGDISIAP